MNNICNEKNINIIKNIILIIKYILPLFIIIIGMIKTLIMKNKKKAIKKLIKYFLLTIIIFLLGFMTEFILKNKYECISCNMEGNCDMQNNINQKIEETINNKETEIINNKEPEIQEPINNENQIEVINGVTYIDGILIVNKTYSLPENYIPANAIGYNRCNECLTQETKQAFNEMKSDANAIGLNLYISSGYRSYTYQEGLYNRYVNKDGKQAADTYSARPGHSEHQTGLAFDLNTIDDSFANTDEGKWVKDNCYKYGLILRYPKGKEEKTGYQYESWHLRYVGKELAQKLYNNGDWITLEEYFEITSIYE